MGPDFNQLSGEDMHRARLHGAWRPRLHLGDVERGAAAVRRVPERLPARATIATALTLQDKLMPLHTAPVRRDQSGAGQVRAVAARQVRRRRCGCRWCRCRRSRKAAVREAMVHAGLIN